MTEEKPLHIFTHPGIGDISWVYSKFAHLDRGISVTIAEDSKHRRSDPFVKMLPNIKSSRYGVGMQDYVRLKQTWNATYEEILEAESEGKQLFISANNWVDSGNRLEGWIPDLPTDFHYQINTTKEHKDSAKEFLPGGAMYLCFHTASVEGMRIWNTWGPGEWLDFLGCIRASMRHVVFAMIGARWDRNMAEALLPLMKALKADVVDLVGKLDLGTSFEVMKRSRYMVGFASGMTIVANVLRKPCLMLYPDSLPKLMYSWPCPESLAFGTYLASTWKRPRDVYRDVADSIEHAFDY